MIKTIRKIIFALSYGDELEQVLIEKRKEKQERDFKENQHRLKLCYKHRQEQNQSHYAEHNCDYCKILEKFTSHGYQPVRECDRELMNPPKRK